MVMCGERDGALTGRESPLHTCHFKEKITKNYNSQWASTEQEEEEEGGGGGQSNTIWAPIEAEK